jgi:hypothetical protein
MKWEDMHAVGDGVRARHCDQCKLNVYNLSEMTADEAEALLARHEGRRLCGAFYRREDGTILTRNCPVGWALVRTRAARVVARLSAAAGLVMTGVVMLGAKARGEPVRLRHMDPFAKIVAWLNPPPVLPSPGLLSFTSGSMLCPPPSPSPLSAPPSGGLTAPAVLELNGSGR